MNSFIKKYWKILVTALVCIVVILVLSYVSMIGKISDSTLRSNSAQKGQIVENIKDTVSFYENRKNILHKRRLDVARKLSEVIYGKGVAEDEKLLNEYFSVAGIDDLVILDPDRNVQYIHGCENYIFTKEHFNDPYYDTVFADADSKSVNEINIAALKDYGKDSIFIKVKEGYWVYAFTALAGEYNTDMHYFWELALENVWVGDYSDIGVMDAASGELIYCRDNDLEGEILDINKNGSYWGRINDEAYYITSHPIEDMSVNVVAITAMSDVVNTMKSQLITIAVLIIGAVTLMITMIIFLREDKVDVEEEIRFLGKYFLKNQLNKYAVMGLVVSVILAASLMLVSELDYMTDIENKMSQHMDKTVALFDDYYEDGQDIENIVYGRYYTYGRIADTFLKHNPAYFTKEGLSYLANIFEVSDITVFDSAGKTISTSSPLDHLSIMSDRESPLYDLRYALMGKEEVCVDADARIQPENISIFAIPSRNENGVTEGIVAVETVTEEIKREEPRGLLEDQAGVMQFCVDKEGTVRIFYDSRMVGKNVSSLGIPEDMIYDGYTGKFERERKNYAALVKSCKAGYTVLVSEYISFSYDVIGTGIISTILFLIAAVIFAYDGLGSKYKFSDAAPENITAKDDKGKTGKWSDLPAAAKMKMVINAYIYCLSLYFILCQWMIYTGSETHETINYIFNGDWDRSVNIFSVVHNVFIIMIYFSVIRWVEAILNKIAAISGPSGETISRLLANIIMYLGSIICLYQVVMNFGVDAKTALASIGIVGFGLTFGAQDMIKDMIAGIFIFFEGNFKVGDMLQINGDWFWVKSIGIRATRVEARGQVKIINNSQMAGALNIQNGKDYVNCDVYIGSEYNIDDIEEILSYELPLLKPKYEPEIPIPAYKGVQEIGANGTKIRISTIAHTLRAPVIKRDLQGDLIRIFSKYGIRVPAQSYEIASANIMMEDRDQERQKRAEAIKAAAERLKSEKETI